MNVGRSNFKEVLPQFQAAVAAADFVAIDAEFTGIEVECGRKHQFEDLQRRYFRTRQAAEAYLLIQFGVSIHTYNDAAHRYDAQTYNFFVFPKPADRSSPDVRFTCQTSSIAFLAGNGFDFNTLFRDGIPYLLKEQEKRLRAKQAPDKKDPIPLGDNEPFINSACESITAWLQSSTEPTLDLEPCNSFLRRLIYQETDARFPNGIVCNTVKPASGRPFVQVKRVSAEQKWTLKAAKKQQSKLNIDDMVGFRRIIDCLSESRKPLVCHNGWMDLAILYAQFIGRLPEALDAFKRDISALFPTVFDTKCLASHESVRQHLDSTILGEMYTSMQKDAFAMPAVAAPDGFQDFDKAEGQLHQAGYDAYVTARCFATMVCFFQSASPAEAAPDYSSPALAALANRLCVTMLQGLNSVCLSGPDTVPDYRLVYHLSQFDATWKTSDLLSALAKIGPARITWLDSSSAYAQFEAAVEAKVAPMGPEFLLDTMLLQQYAHHRAKQHASMAGVVVQPPQPLATYERVDNKRRRTSGGDGAEAAGS